MCECAGGVVVCYGQACSASLSSVRFEDCSLVVAAGAHVTLHACSFAHSTPFNISLVAHGSSTTVDVTGRCVMRGGAQGAAVLALSLIHI